MMNNFKIISNKLCKLLNCDEAKLYILFRVHVQTYRTWKYRNRIPFNQIIKIATQYKLDLNYIFKGQK